ncbi:MAG: TonB-dependent receptor [Acidobacteria bacterium]|nr:TonB-dependent receptor [Acidobacteriota bacterium]
MASALVRLISSAGEAEAWTGGRGEFRFDNLAPGVYEIQVGLPGFEPLRRRVRLGARSVQNLSLRLTLARLEQELTIAEPTFQVNTDATNNAAAISVEGNVLDNLPVLDLNYLSALSRFLEAGAPGGGGTSLIVDGMEMRNVGVTASAIQEIRINNNPYTVEYPRWSRRRIEVITKSSADRYHGTFNFLFRDYSLNARDAFAVERPREQRRIYEGSLFGPVGNSKQTSFLLSGAREEEDLQAVVFAQGPRGPIHDNAPIPQVNTYLSARISWQPSDSQSMFFQQNFQDRWQENIGVGGTTLKETGAQWRFREDEFTFNHRFVFSPKMLSQFRILVGRYWAPTRSNLQAPRTVVTDAFTGGGAQADRLFTEFHTSITWLLTQTAGKHTLKYGINVPDWSRRGLVDRTNEIGSLFYASISDYASNRPYAALLQRGNPKVVFVEKNVGGFLQDEWQVRKNLSIAAGFRYDWQNYFGDRNNLAPRLALAWSPPQTKDLVLRAGAGSSSKDRDRVPFGTPCGSMAFG